jgi:hypothetical protein
MSAHEHTSWSRILPIRPTHATATVFSHCPTQQSVSPLRVDWSRDELKNAQVINEPVASRSDGEKNIPQ